MIIFVLAMSDEIALKEFLANTESDEGTTAVSHEFASCDDVSVEEQKEDGSFANAEQDPDLVHFQQLVDDLLQRKVACDVCSLA